MDLEYSQTGDYVSARATGTPKEIAALVVAIQERQIKSFGEGSQGYTNNLVIKDNDVSKIDFSSGRRLDGCFC